MIDIGVASPSAQGQDDRVGHRGLRSEQAPDHEGHDGGQHDGGNEPASHDVGQALDRRAAALRFGNHPHDLRQHGVIADMGDDHYEGAGTVHGTADDGIARLFLDRHGFAADHRLVDTAAAVRDLAVDRHLVARPYTQSVACAHVVQRHLVLVAIRLDASCRGRRQFQ